MGTNFPTTEVLSYFETGDRPTQTQFATFINGVGTIDGNSPLNNFTATTAPTVNDDSNDGYSVGSRWTNTSTQTEYICVNAIVAAAVWNQVAIGTVGVGTVTSVGLTAPSEFTVTGSPITSSGTIAITRVVQAANSVNAGPTSGLDAVPTFRSLVSADLVNIVGSSFSNLSIATPTTPAATVAASADYVVALSTSGTAIFKSSFSVTINAATVGANGLDGGSLANNTWYYVFAIAKADGTWAGLLSGSSSAPLMPTDYVFKRRIGAVTTNGSALFWPTLQLGNTTQYIVTSSIALRAIASGTAGTYSDTAPVWSSPNISTFIPPTAMSLRGVASNLYNGGSQANVAVAPNTNYAGQNSSNPSPLRLSSSIGVSQQFEFVRETTTPAVVWASSAGGGALLCIGWVDNL